MKAILEQAIKSIEAKRDGEVALIKDRIVREKIAPFNAEVDSFRAKALQEIDAELATKIADLKVAYEAKKQDLIKIGEEKKKENMDSVLASELAVITVKYDTEIAKLNAQLSEIKE